MEFRESATNFDRPHAESCPNGRRTVEIACTISELHALPPKLAGKKVYIYGISATPSNSLHNRMLMYLMLTNRAPKDRGMDHKNSLSWRETTRINILQ